MSLAASYTWNPQGLSRPIQELLYFYIAWDCHGWPSIYPSNNSSFGSLKIGFFVCFGKSRRLYFSRSIWTLLPFWGFMACSRVNYTLTFDVYRVFSTSNTTITPTRNTDIAINSTYNKKINFLLPSTVDWIREKMLLHSNDVLHICRACGMWHWILDICICNI